MSQLRKVPPPAGVGPGPGPAAEPAPTGPGAAGPAPWEAPLPVAARPLSARSVVASTLLGMDPPRLPTRILVASGQLFGIAEGTTRTALSRMAAAGELAADGDGYALAGRLLARHVRQAAARRPEVRAWDGTWDLAVVTGGRRSPAARAELRAAMRTLRLAERREGLWVRPANLDPALHPEAATVVAAQCHRWRGEPLDEDRSTLVAELWDLEGWADEAGGLVAAMASSVGSLERGDVGALAPTFVVAAAVLRHLLADPLLPPELLPAGWPGDGLRATYERYQQAFSEVWRTWYRAQR